VQQLVVPPAPSVCWWCSMDDVWMKTILWFLVLLIMLFLVVESFYEWVLE
jgi:hypothetical protein